jgi:hypothetical protein
VNRLLGVDVQVIPDPRRYYGLPNDVPVTEAFRTEFNAWCERFFQPAPELNHVKDGQWYEINKSVLGLSGKMIVMNQRTFDRLKEAADAS